MLHLFHYELPLIVNLLLLLLAAKVLGEIMERFGQPSMIGEVLAGIILGPSLFNIIPAVGDLRVIADLGVFFLIVMAGLEIEAEEIRNSIRGKQFWIAFFGFIIPFLSGLLLGWGFGFSYTFMVFISLSMAITALPVTIRILMDLGKLNSDIGKKIISSAIFNDIVSLVILGIILDFNDASRTIKELSASVIITLSKVIFFIATLFVSYRIYILVIDKVLFINPTMNKIIHFLKGKEAPFAMVILFVLFFSSISELMGLHFIVGAFFGAILIPRELINPENLQKVKISLSSISSGFLAPIFFACIGVSFNLTAIDNSILLLVMLITAFISKIAGGYLGGVVAGLDHQSSLTIGIGLNARGIMELVIANLAFNLGLIDISIFSILVLISLSTTIITPFLLGYAFRRIDKQKTK